jgi:hypothetical protein
VKLALEDHCLAHQSRAHGPRREPVSLAAATPEGPKRPFVHLTDGGVADNIGLRGPPRGDHVHQRAVQRAALMNKRPHRDAGRDRGERRHQSRHHTRPDAHVPGLIDTITTAADVPLTNYSADSIDLLTATVNEFQRGHAPHRGLQEARIGLGPQCVPNIQAPAKVTLYPVEVAFEYIENPEERHWFKNLPTSFELPRETIDRLRGIGRRLLGEDPEFRKLLKALQGCLPLAGRRADVPIDHNKEEGS